MREEAHQVTITSPRYLGEIKPWGSHRFDYFFNGECFYVYNAALATYKVLPDLDLKTLRNKKYLLGDKQFSIIGFDVYFVPIRKSKRIGKYDHYYFNMGSQLYALHRTFEGVSFVERPDIDIKSLKVIDENFAEDKDFYYQRRGERLSKAELAKDAQKLSTFMACPTHTKAELWLYPRIDNKGFSERVSIIAAWLNEHFDYKWQKYRCQDQFYSLIAAFIEACSHCYLESGEQSYFEQTLACYHRFSRYSFLQPGIYHSLARLHAKNDDKSQAIDAIRTAFQLRYGDMQSIFNDSCLQHLMNDEQLLALRTQYERIKEHYHEITPTLLYRLQDALGDDDELNHFMADRILHNFRLYDLADLNNILENSEDKAAAKDFIQAHKFFFEHYMIRRRQRAMFTSIQFGPMNWRSYQTYKNYQLLKPLTHLYVADAIFNQAHASTNWSETFFAKSQYGKMEQAFEIAAAFFIAVEQHENTGAMLEEAASLPIIEISGGLNKARETAFNMLKQREDRGG